MAFTYPLIMQEKLQADQHLQISLAKLHSSEVRLFE